MRSLKRGFVFGETTTLAVQSVSKLTLRSLKRGFVRSAWEFSEQTANQRHLPYVVYSEISTGRVVPTFHW